MRGARACPGRVRGMLVRAGSLEWVAEDGAEFADVAELGAFACFGGDDFYGC